MKKVRFTEEQMVTILREADRSSVAEVAKKHRVSEQTIYVWRRRFGKLEPADVKRLRELEAENAKLKRMVADKELAIETLKEINRRKYGELAGPTGPSGFGDGTRAFPAPSLRADRIARSILKYRAVRAQRGAPPLDAMRRIAATYPRYGYRRVRIFLRREGHAMSPQRAYRLWHCAGLQLPRRRPRHRAAASRPRPLPALGRNQVWAYDFVHDACANGQKIKCLTIIDEFRRECHAIDVAGSIRSARVIEVLARLISQHGAQLFLRPDNGPEFVSKAILEWLAQAKIDTALIDPGKPWQNGADESFNGKFRDECLSMEWFRSRVEARVLIEVWRRHYNDVRPHSSLDYRTPNEFRRHHESTHQGATLK